jgi:hypothetical protein
MESDDKLIDLATEFGFSMVGENRRGESIFVKELLVQSNKITSLSPLEITQKYYPSFYDGILVNKFIVPILPVYHSRLFTNYEDRQIELTEYAGYFIVEGNTIEKAYICNSNIRKLKQGDLIFFYVSRRKQLITIGIVKTVFYNILDHRQTIKILGKRTVYSIKEIENITQKPALIILFWQYFHLKQPLSYLKLQTLGILRAPPRSIMQISHDNYLKIKDEGHIDERFTVN